MSVTKRLAWNSYYKKAECFLYHDVVDSIYMTRDLKENSGMKEFSSIRIDEIDKVVRILNKDNYNLYEALPPNQPVKPYFDLEMEYKGLTDRLIEIKINNFIKWLIKEINLVFKVSISREDLVILNSSRHEKLSYHIIITRKIYFASVADHKLFINYLVSLFKNNSGQDLDKINRFKYIKPNKKEGYIFDHIPYGTDQNVRFINQSKKGKSHILRNITPNYSIRDTFIRLYEGIGDRILLDINRLNNSMFERAFRNLNVQINVKLDRPRITFKF